MTLLSTEDSDDSQKRMRAVLTIHPTLAYPFFSLIRPLFLCLAQRGSDMRGSTVPLIGKLKTIADMITLSRVSPSG